jgi:hypothetical protein
MEMEGGPVVAGWMHPSERNLLSVRRAAARLRSDLDQRAA